MPGHIDRMAKTKKTVTLGLFAALSLGIYAFESLLPPLFVIPGIKPGLSNIITLYCLKRFGKKEAALVLLVRILISAMLFGNPISLLYSLTGGFAALGIEMISDALLKGKALHLTGAFGGMFHNMGQLLCALFILASVSVLAYAPYLILAGIITGLFTGLASFFLLKIKIPEQP
ncbi:MAG: Gx transporter family protein [Lachnospiraceae bacterium]|nr:Gx transporter family protein [Lachnospiraceae bacterium]